MNESDIVRFNSKIIKDPNTACWNWIGALQNKGYGLFWLDYSMKLAHRVSYLICHGKYPTKNLLHKCDNSKCVNPNHLIEGSQSDNISDMFNKGRQVDQRGEKGPRAILTELEVIKIRKLRKSGLNNVQLGTLYNVHPGTISNLCTGKTWSHIQEGL